MAILHLEIIEITQKPCRWWLNMIKTATASIRTGSLKVILAYLKFEQKCKLIITFYLGIWRNQRNQSKKQGIPIEPRIQAPGLINIRVFHKSSALSIYSKWSERYCLLYQGLGIHHVMFYLSYRKRFPSLHSLI